MDLVVHCGQFSASFEDHQAIEALLLRSGQRRSVGPGSALEAKGTGQQLPLTVQQRSDRRQRLGMFER